MPGPYRLAIFDFDGTLADSFALFAEAYNELAVRHGFKPVTTQEVQRLRSLHAREIMKQVGMPAWKLPVVAKEYIGIMRTRRQEVRPFPGTAQMLARLDQSGVALAVVSSNAEDNVRTVLGESARLVGHYACGMSIFGKRSHLRQALQAADLDAARAEGIDFGAVAWGYGDAGHLEALSPTLIFRRMEEIETGVT